LGGKEKTQKALNENSRFKHAMFRCIVKLMTVLKITSRGKGPWENELVRTGSWCSPTSCLCTVSTDLLRGGQGQSLLCSVHDWKQPAEHKAMQKLVCMDPMSRLWIYGMQLLIWCQL